MTYTDRTESATAQRDPRDEANARRIVAAINACEGIGTEALEQGVFCELLEALTAASDWIDAQLGRPRTEIQAKVLQAIASAAANSPASPRKPIVIEVRGGIVQDVLNVPPGHEYEVKDYDDLDAALDGATAT